MNLIQQAEQLKMVPDQALSQMQQRPTDVPPYLVVAEMQRRMNMRKAYEAAQGQNPMNQPPVAQQVGQQFQQQGQPPTGGPPQGPPPQQPMQMAGGGLADLSKYFQGMMGGRESLPEVNPALLGMSQFPSDPRWDEMRKWKANPRNPEDWKAHLARIQEQTGESPLVAEAAKFEEQEKGLRSKKPNINQLLIQLGLGMAGSRRPDLMGMIAEGGASALNGFTNERDRNTALVDRAGARRLQALEGVQRHKDRIQDYAIDAARSAQSGYNTDRANDTNIELAILRQQKEEELAQRLADRQITQQEAEMQLAIFNKGADEDRRLAEKKFDRETQLLVQDLRNKRPKGSGKEADPAKANAEKIKQFSTLARQFDMEASALDKTAAAIINPNDPQRMALSQQAAASRKKAAEYRGRVESLMNGDAPPAADKKTFGFSDLIMRFLNGAGAAPTGAKASPLVIPPPPR